MKIGVPYTMSNTVIEFEPDRRIAWQTCWRARWVRFVGGRIWRYELEETGGGTKVTETWDITPGQAGLPLASGAASGQQTGQVHVQDARPPGRAHRVAPAS